MDFIIKSGRALLFPVYKGAFERGSSDFNSDMVGETVRYRDHTIMWSKDLRRSVDDLETRGDVDMGRLAYAGFSWGARMAPIVLAVEDRFTTGFLALGGFEQQRILPEADPFYFAPRVRVPVLMVNGRYDFLFPIEASQRPMFEPLRTRPED